MWVLVISAIFCFLWFWNPSVLSPPPPPVDLKRLVRIVEPEETEVRDLLVSATLDKSPFNPLPQLKDSLQVVGALNRVRKSLSCARQGQGQTLHRSLTRIVTDRLDKIDNFQSTNRPTVIRRTSTPNVTPPPFSPNCSSFESNFNSRSPKFSEISGDITNNTGDKNIILQTLLQSYLPSQVPTPNLSPEVNLIDISPELSPEEALSEDSSIFSDFLSPSIGRSRCPLSLSCSAPGSSIYPTLCPTADTMEADEQNCARLDRKLDRLLRRHRPEDIDKGLIKLYNGLEKEIKEIDDTCDELVESIENLTLNYKNDLGDLKVREWSGKLEDVEGKVRRYRGDVAKKIAEASETGQPAPGIAISRESSVSSSRSNTEEATRRAMVEVQIAAKTIAEDGKALAAEIRKVEDWGLVDDMMIELAMRNIETWKKKMDKLVDRSRDVEKLTGIHNIDATHQVSSTALVETLKSELEIIIKNIQHEDTERYLFTLNTSKPANMKMPSFSGDPTEDFDKFKFIAKSNLADFQYALYKLGQIFCTF